MKFTTIPVTIEAQQLDVSNRLELSKWANGGLSGTHPIILAIENFFIPRAWYIRNSNAAYKLFVVKGNGEFNHQVAVAGDWVVKWPNGQLEVFSDEEFNKQFE